MPRSNNITDSYKSRLAIKLNFVIVGSHVKKQLRKLSWGLQLGILDGITVQYFVIFIKNYNMIICLLTFILAESQTSVNKEKDSRKPWFCVRDNKIKISVLLHVLSWGTPFNEKLFWKLPTSTNSFFNPRVILLLLCLKYS